MIEAMTLVTMCMFRRMTIMRIFTCDTQKIEGSGQLVFP